MNTITVIGNLTADPETPTEKLVKFTVADNGNRKDQKAIFHDVIVWTGPNAEFVKKFVKKGSAVAVTGTLEDNSYENKDGVTIRKNQVVAYNVGFAPMGGGKGAGTEGGGGGNSKASSGGGNGGGSYGNDSASGSDFDDDDIPF